MTAGGNAPAPALAPEAAWSSLRRRERRYVWLTLAGLLRHRIAAHLNVIVGRAAMIASGSLTREAAIDNARTIREQAEKAVLVLDRLTGATGEAPESVAPACDVRSVLRETERWLRAFAPELELRVVVEAPDAATWVGDEQASLLALVSLCEVAADTCTASRVLRVHVRRDPADAGEADAALVVALEWPSDRARELVDAAAPDALFDVPHRAGVLLSLALARKLARLHGGDLVVDPSTQGTARCELRWPLAQGPSDDSRAGASRRSSRPSPS